MGQTLRWRDNGDALKYSDDKQVFISCHQHIGLRRDRGGKISVMVRRISHLARGSFRPHRQECALDGRRRALRTARVARRGAVAAALKSPRRLYVRGANDVTN